MALDLPFIWAGLIAVAVLLYVLLDGFDLGIGILFPTSHSEEDRKVMMNTVAPVWDGNETWLILGGGGLFAVFPLAYAIVFTALYVPLTIMILALIFRGVSFEYRFRSVNNRAFWDKSFFIGSVVATFCQGISLGALVQGIEFENRGYSGGWFDWLTPFSLLTGIALVVGYALLGATWLVMKTEGKLQQRMRKYSWPLAIGTMSLIGLVSLLTPLQNDVYMQRWFTFPASIYSYIVPIIIGILFYQLYLGTKDDSDYKLFLSAIGIFVACFIGIGISFYPMIVPPSLSIWEAAGPDISLGFILVGTAFLLPFILMYTIYNYWVFRGKVKASDGYH